MNAAALRMTVVLGCGGCTYHSVQDQLSGTRRCWKSLCCFLCISCPLPACTLCTCLSAASWCGLPSFCSGLARLCHSVNARGFCRSATHAQHATANRYGAAWRSPSPSGLQRICSCGSCGWLDSAERSTSGEPYLLVAFLRCCAVKPTIWLPGCGYIACLSVYGCWMVLRCWFGLQRRHAALLGAATTSPIRLMVFCVAAFWPVFSASCASSALSSPIRRQIFLPSCHHTPSRLPLHSMRPSFAFSANGDCLFVLDLSCAAAHRLRAAWRMLSSVRAAGAAAPSNAYLARGRALRTWNLGSMPRQRTASNRAERRSSSLLLARAVCSVQCRARPACGSRTEGSGGWLCDCCAFAWLLAPPLRARMPLRCLCHCACALPVTHAAACAAACRCAYATQRRLPLPP